MLFLELIIFQTISTKLRVKKEVSYFLLVYPPSRTNDKNEWHHRQETPHTFIR